jgi:aspartate/methionine/tyrosine aminotransferase
VSKFFQRSSYIQWVRDLVAAMEGRPGAVGLFDATMDEPFDLLRETAGRVLSEPGQPRLRSVMGAGNPLVLRALADRYGVGQEQILCATGALSGVSLVLKALVQPGDHVLIERPHLDTLVELAAGQGAEIGYIERSADDGAFDLDQVQDALRPNTRLLLITNLHNPTGALLSEADLGCLAEVAARGRTRIVVDEVYADYVHRLDGGRPAARLSDVFVSINSLSKVYGLSSLKCGWIVADARTIKEIAPTHALHEFGMSKLTHAMASLVLEDDAPFTKAVRSVLGEARPLVEAWAGALREEGLIAGAVPAAGCMYFPRLPHVGDTRKFAAWLWREYAIAAAPGELFQSPGHIRIGFGRRADRLAPVLARLAEALRIYCGALA